MKMASQKKENWWVNIPKLTTVMDMMVPRLASLSKNTSTSRLYKQELNHVCLFLSP